MPKRSNSQELTSEQRLRAIASILAKAPARRVLEVKSRQRITSSNAADSCLAVFPETSVGVPVPASKRGAEVGDES